MTRFLILIAGLLVSGAVFAGSPKIEHYSSNPEMELPFSEAVRVGHMLYLSGKIGNIPGTSNLAEGGIQG